MLVPFLTLPFHLSQPSPPDPLPWVANLGCEILSLVWETFLASHCFLRTSKQIPFTFTGNTKLTIQNSESKPGPEPLKERRE